MKTQQITTRYNRSTPFFLSLVASLLFYVMQPALADEKNSGFLDDYSDLTEAAPGVLMATIPDVTERVAQYDAIMIDQPEFRLDDDSRYDSLKPDEIKLIADTLRLALMQKFEHSSYRLVSSPGPTTLYLRTGITEVGMKKKHMRIVQFTPIGLAATLATAPLRDIMDKLILQRYTIEAELYDSVSEERFARFVDSSREEKADDSWESIMDDLHTGSDRMVCRLENARLAADAREDCFAKFPFTDDGSD